MASVVVNLQSSFLLIAMTSTGNTKAVVFYFTYPKRPLPPRGLKVMPKAAALAAMINGATV